SDNACSAWSTRSNSSFCMTRRVVGVTAVVVPIRSVWPAMQPSPKKSVGPNIATTASLPDPFTTENLTPPFWTYRTVSAPSPWEKIGSFFRYSTTLLDTPAVSRKVCGSKEPLLPCFLTFSTFIFTSKPRLGLNLPCLHYPTKKFFPKLYNIEQRQPLRIPHSITGRRERAILAKWLGGPKGRYQLSRRSVFCLAKRPSSV